MSSAHHFYKPDALNPPCAIAYDEGVFNTQGIKPMIEITKKDSKPAVAGPADYFTGRLPLLPRLPPLNRRV